ncbi:DegT/DnrJ/EryC1/StrS family aminotransferase [Aestuariivirga litoralis]|uniref:DegT/DnrJ/EryC1/StrS family aminotransferase n=1 Tax=Aestuariivirga litoralis TaxID=2650924 RepID=UPI0018C71809|nr:DegT/DnrJ/EryC1/StrS family aminotransferase [Aestuariivirga litoralis]MBG1233228.1 DegT/DnrJ/EryC1/StrS family aminotransferase [Aestuariivirga litoralis]
MLNSGFSVWPNFTQDEAQAVSRVLMSNKVNYWTGEEGRLFEKEFASWMGAKHAIALSNGTLALDLALHGLKVGRVNGGAADDEVIVTPRSFIASVSCVVNAGAAPVFVDVDPTSGNLSAASIKPVLSPRTKAIIVVHLAGQPCDMDAIMALARPRGIKVIEDCAQAHGGAINGKSLGTFGDVAAWSFCQDKIMTTGGEGGMVTCDDEGLWQRMWSFKDHGKSWDSVYDTQHPRGFRWVHDSIGTNWRMLEMQAVLGRIQLTLMDEWHAKRKENALRIWDAASRFSCVDVPHLPDGHEHAFYKAYIHVNPERLKPSWSRDRIVSEINAFKVPCYHGSCSEIYLENAFDGTPWRPAQRLPHARRLGETSLMFLVHPTLTEREIDKTCGALAQVLSEAQA